MTSKMFSLDPIEGFSPITFAGHKDFLVASFFSLDMQTVSNHYFYKSKMQFQPLPGLYHRQRWRPIR